tara:strand:- start:593 stop:1375 length:783 start_codon:yes stop_codon:yes gene_type:complete
VEYIETDEVELWTDMNMNPGVIHWVDEEQPQTAINLFKKINKNSKLTTKSRVIQDAKYLGVNEHRRHTIEHTSTDDDIIFLDSDLYFSKTLLRDIIIARNRVSKFLDYYIITPQTIRLWDDTWNCITHSDYISESYSYYKNPPVDAIVKKDYGSFNIKPIVQFKWGGGWFNCISSKLLKKIGIPRSFIGYGPDDTFVMECCRLMRRHKQKVQQYLLTNQVVCEQRNPKKLLTLLKKRTPSFREDCNKNFPIELTNFMRKL